MNIDLSAIGSQLAVLVAWTAALWVIIRPHFADKVLDALKTRAGDFQKWNNELYADWRREQVDAQHQIAETHSLTIRLVEELSRHRTELQDHRTEVKDVFDTLTHMPAALNHLASAITGLNHTIEKLDATTRAQGERIAKLEAKP